MNIRLSEGKIRIRISHAEYLQLLQKSTLHLHMKLPACTWHYQLEVADSPTAALVFEAQPNQWLFYVDSKTLQEYAQQPLSKQGLEQDLVLPSDNMLTLSLEIDVKTRPRSI